MSTNQANMASQLERLVAGELDEKAREPLVAWLDADSSRWRMCGLLFLEAQTWSQALEDWSAEAAWRGAPACRPVDDSIVPVPRRGNQPLARQAGVLAASVLIAFALGFGLRVAAEKEAPPATIASTAAAQNADPDQGQLPVANRPMPILATMSADSRLGGSTPAAIQIPVVHREAATSGPSLAESIPEYVRQQWRRRGYQLGVERRYLFAKLPDGEQVAVPVEQYSIKRIPQRIN